MRNEDFFKKIFTSQITRPGAPELLAWLDEQTDFFTAPASTKYHGARPGGLLAHSLNVYDELSKLVLNDWNPGNVLFDMDFSFSAVKESVTICALLHDVCKVNVYHKKVEKRTHVNGGTIEHHSKDYTYCDNFPLGHGEKSLYLISKFIRLRDKEALAIRWHMGAYDDAVKGGSRALSAAMAGSQLVYELHAADMRATQAEERRERENPDKGAFDDAGS